MTLGISARSADAKTFDGCVADIDIARAHQRAHHHACRRHHRQDPRHHQAQREGLLGPDITYVHPTGISDDEFKMIFATDGTLSSAPVAEMLSQGSFPNVQQWLSFGLRPSLSSDNETRVPSDMFTRASRALDVGSRAGNRSARASKAASPICFHYARSYPSRPSMARMRPRPRGDQTGSITVGKRADMILIDLTDIQLIPVNGDPVATGLTHGRPSDVSWVFVDGQVKKRNGKLIDLDVAHVRKVVQALHDFLTERAQAEAAKATK